MDISFYNLLQYVENAGPVAGILLPVIESFCPILPLIAFVIINVSAFGFFFGYLYSWIGNCLGSFLLFLLIRRVGGKKFKEKIQKSKHKKILENIKKNNLTVLFFLYCFPFTPSFLISGASALANMNTKHFLAALLPSKFIMLLSLAFIGENVNSFFEKPVESVIYILFILLINFIGSKLFKKYESREREK
jgi:uncharacterized membrane protein YdjX (TVP38/TMEM64 family)